MGKTQRVMEIENDPKAMLFSWAACGSANDASGEKLFANILKEKHGLDVDDPEALDVFIEMHAKK